MEPKISWIAEHNEILVWAIPSGITFATGVIAAIVATIAIRSNRDIARRKNSIDTILHVKNDNKLRDSIELTGKIHKDPEVDVCKYAYDDHKFSSEAQAIRYTLNFYEYIAVGINHKVYNEDILKDSMHGTIVRIYERCGPYITELRRQISSDTAYCNFETLAKKWISNPIKHTTKKS